MSGPALEVSIRAGIPGMPEYTLEHGKPYPSNTTDMAKIFAELGYNVVFEDERSDRSYVSHYAADVWIPIVQVTAAVLTAAGGNLLSEAIIRMLGGKSENTLLHVDYTVVGRDVSPTHASWQSLSVCRGCEMTSASTLSQEWPSFVTTA